ncbi:MAG: DUF5615 family PIN-like protein [Thermomicrobiales bacterium]
MARFYLDENLPEYLVICLQELGHDAVSTLQLGLTRSSVLAAI